MQRSIGSLARQIASSPDPNRTSADYQQMFETQLTALFRMVPSFDESGFKRGVDEETAKKLVQSLVAEYRARYASDSGEELSLMFQRATEQVRQNAKQVI